MRVETVNRFCDTQYNGRQQCQFQEDVGNCAIGDPPPTPTPTPTPGPASGDCDPAARPNCPYSDCDPRTGQWACCDPSTRPNPDCPCQYSNRTLRVDWDCHLNCLATGYSPADFPRYPATGCAPNSYNEGNCCKCYNQSPSCPGGFSWDKSRCQCCDSSGQCTEATAGGGGGEYVCDPYCRGGGLGRFDRLGGALILKAAYAPALEVDPCCMTTPVAVDVLGDGFAFTSAEEGVPFDFNADGRRGLISWTAPGSDDAWLTLDRDGDGRVGDGRELFGNFTPQPPAPPGSIRNGFLALAEFDKPAQGGNSDGVIDARDRVYASLRLWRDADHDGVSAPDESSDLPSSNVARLHLDYRESKRTDEHGNRFRFRAKVDDAKGAKVSRWAWDVFLVSAK